MLKRSTPIVCLSVLTAAIAARADAAPHEVGETRGVVREGAPNPLLLTSGAATFAFGYGAAAWVGATSTLSTDRALLLPLAGPWLALATRAPCDGATGGICGHETTYDVLLVADGLVQLAGVAQFALAFVRRDLRTWREQKATAARWNIIPTRTPGGGLAIAAVGHF